MDDKKIRGILIEYLRERFDGARIYEERGIGDSVCDLMLVTNCLSFDYFDRNGMKL